MVTTEEVRTVFTADTGDLEEAAERGSRALENHGKAAEHAGSRHDVFLQSERRVAHNLGEIARVATSGADAYTVLGRSIALAGESVKGGLALGGAVLVGFEAAEGLVKAGEAAIKFREEVEAITRPVGNSNFLGLNDIQKNLTDVGGKLDEIYKRDSFEKGGFAGNASKLGRRIVGKLIGDGSFEEQDAREAKEKTELRKTAADDVQRLAEKTRALNEVEVIRIHQGERQAELARELLIEHNEKLGAIAKAAPLGVDTRAASNAENERHANADAVIGYKYAVQDQQIDNEQKLAEIQKLRSEGAITRNQAELDTVKLNLAAAKDLLAYYERIKDADAIAKQKVVVANAQTKLNDTEFSTATDTNKYGGYSYNFAQHETERNEAQRHRAIAANAKDAADRKARGASAAHAQSDTHSLGIGDLHHGGAEPHLTNDSIRRMHHAVREEKERQRSRDHSHSVLQLGGARPVDALTRQLLGDSPFAGKGSGEHPVVGSVDKLINTLNELPGKIGVI